MLDNDKRLLEVYMMGWNDSPDNNNRSREFSGLEFRAYELGWCDYIIGDDIPSRDYRSGDEILKEIKNEKE